MAAAFGTPAWRPYGGPTAHGSTANVAPLPWAPYASEPRPLTNWKNEDIDDDEDALFVRIKNIVGQRMQDPRVTALTKPLRRQLVSENRLKPLKDQLFRRDLASMMFAELRNHPTFVEVIQKAICDELAKVRVRTWRVCLFGSEL